jgi:hypothetical protein
MATMATTQQKERKQTKETAAVHGHQSPQHEHHWLEKLVGEWRVEGKMMGPAGNEETTGEETWRSLDGLWFIGEGEGEMPGGNKGTTIFTLGYDPREGKYVGSFIGSMMTNQWIYEGELDETERKLTLDTEGPEFTPEGVGEKLVPYQDTLEFIDDNHRVLKSHAKKDGKWQQFIEVHYYRKGNGEGASRR